MTEEQILQMIKEYFNEGGIRDDGSCSEYYGDLGAFLKFASKLYYQGRYDGYYDGSHCGPRCAFRLEQQAENYDD